MNKLQLILLCLRHGCRVFPLLPASKKPAVRGGSKAATKNKAKVTQYFIRNPDSNYGIATGSRSNFFVLDVDGPAGEESLRGLEQRHGRLPDTVTVLTGQGRHLYFAADGGQFGNSAGRAGTGLDIRGDNGYVVGPGSVHPSGRIYKFARGRGFGEIAVASAPQWLLQIASKHKEKQTSDTTLVIPQRQQLRAKRYAEAAFDQELRRLRIAPVHQRNATLNRSAFSLGQLCALNLLDRSKVSDELARVACEIGLEEDEIRPTIASGISAGSQHPRRLHFLQPLGRPEEDQSEPAVKESDELLKELAALGQTDSDNAQRFARRLGHKVIYAPGRGLMMFDGKRYQPSAYTHCIPLAEETARLIKAESQHLEGEQARAARAKFGEQSLSKGALDRTLDLAKSYLLVDDHSLDADPWLLNVLNGTINLRTGELQAHDRRDLLTKVAPVEADSTAKCPNFKRFLKRALGGDKELMVFVQKAVGMTLTGVVSEQVFFFLFGPGRSGKSTFTNMIRDMMGDYGLHTPSETLLAKQYDNGIPTDLARLVGCRMLTAIEANWNRHIDEARIKAMTGGEPITARFMRQDYFEFQPEFKLWFVANDFPRVRGTAGAFWERVRAIPFMVSIPDEERDRNLPEKLRAEWPGILAWAVRGCLLWQREGLKPARAVERTTGRWKDKADHLKKFVQEQVIFEAGESTSASDLYRHYMAWCERSGEKPLSIKVLKIKLSDFDLEHARGRHGSIWRGIKLRK